LTPPESWAYVRRLPPRWSRVTVIVCAIAALAVSGCSGRTTGATHVTDASARLNVVGSCDTTCSVFVRWRRAGTTAWTNATPFTAPKTSNVTWHQDATGLAAGTAYEYQACGKEASYSSYVCVGPDGTTGSVGAFKTTGGAAAQPPGFSQTTVFSGLINPTAVRFAPDGRVFVAEYRGIVKVFDSITDTTPTTFADLRTNVYGYWDMGLLGLALPPNFPADPYVYVLYTYDGVIGGPAPRWGDTCPSPPGPTTDGCLASGRLSRLRAAGNVMTGSEQVLIHDWCQQYMTHSVGDLAFGPGGALYVSGGDSAHPDKVDYGQGGGSPGSPTPKNPCGDPPGGVGATLSPPTARGGALRSQSLRRPAGEPRVLNGTVARVNPATGAALPNNPLASSASANERRIVAAGLRNPFRFALRPGTDELWIGDVGNTDWEEIDRVPAPLSAPVKNFGWPCYEGAGPQGSWQSTGLSICSSLYAQSGAVTAPFTTYHHASKVAGESCLVGSSSVTGVAFQPPGGGSYGSEYDGALFFADRSRRCIWAMLGSSTTLPDRAWTQTFVAGAANPVDLQTGPGGDLYYADLDGGTVRRIRYTAGNRPPVAVAGATPTSGEAPLTVAFDATQSSDPDPNETLTYSWDLDGDGAFGDSALARPTFTYTTPGTYTARLRVTDAREATSTDTVTITAGNSPPTAHIEAPTGAFTWAVGDPVDFRGSATDGQDGALGASALSWAVVMQHCPSTCHSHLIEDFDGVAAGSFDAPDHGYPSHLELRLTATDSGGLTDVDSVRIDPRTVDVTLRSSPSGLTLALDSFSGTTPFTRTVIEGSTNTISAPAMQTLGGTSYSFSSWSDGGAPTHQITPTATTARTATYDAEGGG
jgi:glucose/arabinose dehydrogenase